MTRRAAWMLAGCALVVFGCGGGAASRLDEAATLSAGGGGPKAATRLEELVRDRDARVRAVALVGLMRVAPSGGIDAVVAALEDADPEVRAVAARAAGEAGVATAAPVLAGLARSDGNEAVRRQAVAALARLPGSTADEALVEAANDPSEAIRLEAIRGLSDEAVGLAAGTLAAHAIGDVSWEVRAASLAALARAGVPRAWAIAEAAGTDGSEFVRAEAARALERLRRDGVPRVEPDPQAEGSGGPAAAVYTPRPDLDAGGPIEGPPDSP